MPSTQVIQTPQLSQVLTKGQQQQSRRQPNSFLVVDDQQDGPSRPLTFTLTQARQFNPPSFASATGEVSQHNISRLRILWEYTLSASHVGILIQTSRDVLHPLGEMKLTQHFQTLISGFVSPIPNFCSRS